MAIYEQQVPSAAVAAAKQSSAPRGLYRQSSACYKPDRSVCERVNVDLFRQTAARGRLEARRPRSEVVNTVKCPALRTFRE